jgi:hypothetical protein
MGVGMRSAPASLFKTGRKSHAPRNAIPSEGSKLRAIYDRFQASKGRVIDYSSPNNDRLLADLTDYYGLDIRRVARCKWVLAGEWFGRAYLDYLAEHLASQEVEA